MYFSSTSTTIHDISDGNVKMRRTMTMGFSPDFYVSKLKCAWNKEWLEQIYAETSIDFTFLISCCALLIPCLRSTFTVFFGTTLSARRHLVSRNAFSWSNFQQVTFTNRTVEFSRVKVSSTASLIIFAEQF